MPDHTLGDTSHSETLNPGAAVRAYHDEITFVRLGGADHCVVRDAGVDTRGDVPLFHAREECPHLHGRVLAQAAPDVFVELWVGRVGPGRRTAPALNVRNPTEARTPPYYQGGGGGG